MLLESSRKVSEKWKASSFSKNMGRLLFAASLILSAEIVALEKPKPRNPPDLLRTPAPLVDRSELPPNDLDKLRILVNDQMAVIRTFDQSRAYYAFMSKDFKKTVPLEDFKAFVRAFPSYYRNKTITEKSTYLKAGAGYFEGVLISIDGNVLRVEYDCVEEEGEWKIQAIRLFS